MRLTNDDTAEKQRGTLGRCRRLTSWVVLATLALAVSVSTLLIPSGPVAGQEAPALYIDANPAANDATHVDSVQSCFAPAVGDTFAVDVVIEEVQELLAWQLYVEFDPALLEVVDRRVDMFQGANRGSSVYDVSDPVPGTASPYGIAAADVSDPPTPDSGTGVLGRLTFRAKAAGTSPLAFARQDVDDDGLVDRASFLRNIDSEPIGDEDGDTFFDGDANGAEISIGSECEDEGGTIVGNGLDEAGDSVGTGIWIAVGAGAGLMLVFGLAGAVLWRRRYAGTVADS
jgi:hypothetical protein